MDELLPLSLSAWIFIGVYLLSLIAIGFIAKQAREENTLRDFYLAGHGFGFAVLFLTLFATQYSGNTFFAFTGATYRIGYPWILCLHFMTTVVIVFQLFARRLHAIARKRGFVTPGDYLQDRFGSRLLTVLATLVLIVVLANFLLAQLMAMGRAMQGLAETNPEQAYAAGVIVLALAIKYRVWRPEVREFFFGPRCAAHPRDWRDLFPAHGRHSAALQEARRPRHSCSASSQEDHHRESTEGGLCTCKGPQSDS